MPILSTRTISFCCRFKWTTRHYCRFTRIANLRGVNGSHLRAGFTYWGNWVKSWGRNHILGLCMRIQKVGYSGYQRKGISAFFTGWITNYLIGEKSRDKKLDFWEWQKFSPTKFSHENSYHSNQRVFRKIFQLKFWTLFRYLSKL